MYANYHTHTTRCNHAIGTEREYIEWAIESGMKELGFSDHVPYPFPKWHTSNFRMKLSQLPDYIGTLEGLRNEYKSDINILIGFEAEYYPEYFSQMLEILNQYNYDYLILGQHFLENETSGIYSGDRTTNEDTLAMYVNQTIEGMKTGKFSYIAHPDVINYIGSDKIYYKYVTRLCEMAKEMKMPLEINFLGMREHRNYPCDKFFKIVSEVGNEIIFGCDAHSPKHVYDADTFEKCAEFALRFGLKPIESLQLKNPKI